MSNQAKTVLAALAHPDDAEFMCAGTLALLKRNGWDVHIATMTPGDCGSANLPREEISRVRKAEAAQAAALLEGQYHCLECDDVFILYDKPTLLNVIALIRRVRPTLVFAPSPCDYFADHEHTSRLVQTACFACGVPNISTDEEPFDSIPWLYYVDPLEGKDQLGRAVEPTTLVNISDVMDLKEQMLCCHASQRDWLMAHHGMDEYVEAMKRLAAQRGETIGCQYAEGFRQHLGHAFPRENLLKMELKHLATVS
ncbi:MAG: PIG-L family deacetylase [Phycisphaerae bacterium]|nr:PIG-L family deacetylase [Phycisphaerae bacterium]